MNKLKRFHILMLALFTVELAVKGTNVLPNIKWINTAVLAHAGCYLLYLGLFLPPKQIERIDFLVRPQMVMFLIYTMVTGISQLGTNTLLMQVRYLTLMSIIVLSIALALLNLKHLRHGRYD